MLGTWYRGRKKGCDGELEFGDVYIIKSLRIQLGGPAAPSRRLTSLPQRCLLTTVTSKNSFSCLEEESLRPST